MGTHIEKDWAECDLVECVPGWCGGRSTVKGTRIEPDAILLDAEMGSTPEEIHESFPSLPVGAIQGILDFARNRRPVQ